MRQSDFFRHGSEMLGRLAEFLVAYRDDLAETVDIGIPPEVATQWIDRTIVDLKARAAGVAVLAGAAKRGRKGIELAGTDAIAQVLESFALNYGPHDPPALCAAADAQLAALSIPPASSDEAIP